MSEEKKDEVVNLLRKLSTQDERFEVTMSMLNDLILAMQTVLNVLIKKKVFTEKEFIAEKNKVYKDACENLKKNRKEIINAAEKLTKERLEENKKNTNYAG